MSPGSRETAESARSVVYGSLTLPAASCPKSSPAASQLQSRGSLSDRAITHYGYSILAAPPSAPHPHPTQPTNLHPLLGKDNRQSRSDSERDPPRDELDPAIRSTQSARH